MSEVAELRAKLDAQRKTYMDAMRGALKKTQQLEGDIRICMEENDRLQAENAELKAKVSERSEEIVELKARLAELLEENAELEAKVSEQSGEIAELKARLSELSEENAELRAEEEPSSTEKKQIKALKAKIRELEDEKKQAEITAAAEAHERAVLQNRRDEAERAAREAQLRKLKKINMCKANAEKQIKEKLDHVDKKKQAEQELLTKHAMERVNFFMSPLH